MGSNGGLAMIAEADLWRAVNLLLELHGADAWQVAAERADELLGEGNSDGCAVWTRILKAVAELARAKIARGERVN